MLKKKFNFSLLLVLALVLGFALFVGHDHSEEFATPLIDEINEIVEENRGVHLKVGEPAPEFELKRFNGEGETMRLTGFSGGDPRAVIVNFWASWCSFCITEMPLLEKFHQDYRDDVAVIGINLQEDYLDVLKGFVDSVGVTYPILLDPDGEAMKSYRVVVQPQTFFIDKEGILRDVHYGPFTVKQLLEKGRALME